MTSAASKRVVVLAEPESLMLPNSLARLAQLHPLAAIVEVPPLPARTALQRALPAFGPPSKISSCALAIAAWPTAMS